MAVTRLLQIGDAQELAAALNANREFLAPWDPIRSDDYFTAEAQRAVLESALDAYAREAMVPLAIVDEGGQLIGRVTINGNSACTGCRPRPCSTTPAPRVCSPATGSSRLPWRRPT